MVQILAPATVLTEEDRLFLQTVDDDTEEAPWMVMGTPQAWSASGLAWSLRMYKTQRQLPWFVATMLPILYQRPGLQRLGQVAPDVFVAFVEDRERQSYNLQEEGVVPAFVLEVISPSSVRQDTITKRRTYRLLGVQEYVLFAPQPSATLPALQGYRRSVDGRFLPWRVDGQGRLRSTVLDLYLVAEGRRVRAQQRDGTPLLTPEQETAARHRAEGLAQQEAAARHRADLRAQQADLHAQQEADARHQAELLAHQELAARHGAELLAQQETAARHHAELLAHQEAEGRRQAEDEVARLRAELQRYRPHD